MVKNRKNRLLARAAENPRSGATICAVTLLFLAMSRPIPAQVVYNSIPSIAAANLPGEGPEAYAFTELGDGLVFAGSHRKLSAVTVILSDWACTNGTWFNPVGSTNPCVTIPGTSFGQPITVNIYGVNPGPSAGALLASKTTVFAVPYRPSSDALHCAPDGKLQGDGTQWYDADTNTCNHGIAFPIAFDFRSDDVILPDRAIITFAFNTTHSGRDPIGETAPCFSSPQGCPYDLLNIVTGGTQVIGNGLDPDGAWISYTNPANSCSGNAAPARSLINDAPCFTGSHPQIRVDAEPADGEQVGDAASLIPLTEGQDSLAQ